MKRIFKAFSYPATVWFPKTEHNFLIFICASFMIAMFATPYSQVAMWVGFLFAAYAAIANDSIQTIGTFIASNQDKKWWILWIFIGGIFITTMSYSWMTVDENGLTIFSPKKSEKEIFDNISMRISKKDDNYVEWNIKDTEIDGATNYDSDYLNPDYGNCFFLKESLQGFGAAHQDIG